MRGGSQGWADRECPRSSSSKKNQQGIDLQKQRLPLGFLTERRQINGGLQKRTRSQLTIPEYKDVENIKKNHRLSSPRGYKAIDF